MGEDRGTSVINVIILSPGKYVDLIAVLPRIIYERSYRKQARKEERNLTRSLMRKSIKLLRNLRLT